MSRKVLLVGGGSGGHTTPIIFVAEELHNLSSDVLVYYVGHKSDSKSSLFSNKHYLFKKFYSLSSGKYRRYSDQTMLQKLKDTNTIIHNIKDLIKIALSILKSFYILMKVRPNAVFFRGSYLGVPICIAAGILGIQYYIHESDATPSLSNRLVAKNATKIFVSYPQYIYKYPKQKMLTTGVPLSPQLKNIHKIKSHDLRIKHHVPKNSKVILITGGGLGAHRLNEVASEALINIEHQEIFVIHLAGKGKTAEYRTKYEQKFNSRFILCEQVSNDLMIEYMIISDLIISRAGMTSISEFGYLSKPVILVPNKELPDSHQAKNANFISENAACIQTNEDVQEIKQAAISILNNSNGIAVKISHNINKLFGENTNASQIIAKELL